MTQSTVSPTKLRSLSPPSFKPPAWTLHALSWSSALSTMYRSARSCWPLNWTSSARALRRSACSARKCVELACVQDADRLDAIGAFGVLRCAAFSGARNRTLHDPKDVAIEDISYAQYVEQGGSGTAVAHFHEKLLKLAGMMKTDAAKQQAKDRHQFMIQFLAQIQQEYDFASLPRH
ncbi:hypothetical protein DL89DRAFT_18408 [Linderina pennispora]|uniref:HD domain-containing protein n=1 Tax=Linderina pennispora TaxID=61395 RepID=A0A1Y1WLT9_9FUNG|nr:uncharacterized protein DL89DRAFT_18408 [Linderina pennispora]ORX74527.1 hypothetical protein DL89DRAFT_18408 [Linderina pennispora]